MRFSDTENVALFGVSTHLSELLPNAVVGLHPMCPGICQMFSGGAGDTGFRESEVRNEMGPILHTESGDPQRPSRTERAECQLLYQLCFGKSRDQKMVGGNSEPMTTTDRLKEAKGHSPSLMNLLR